MIIKIPNMFNSFSIILWIVFLIHNAPLNHMVEKTVRNVHFLQT